ncbi:hypothetical protein ARMSODRAFT_1028481 [Armillaria solidipes]|uniref:Uncharacterized protein n=1 Tax=Armillaria solidipes TaxID=1076256 RepID=A0A2H3ATB9_9AGAR|nr:hypothetical protein ARMSODRAFT_1028481 [Armillaria solidipes]
MSIREKRRFIIASCSTSALSNSGAKALEYHFIDNISTPDFHDEYACALNGECIRPPRLLIDALPSTPTPSQTRHQCYPTPKSSPSLPHPTSDSSSVKSSTSAKSTLCPRRPPALPQRLTLSDLPPALEDPTSVPGSLARLSLPLRLLPSVYSVSRAGDGADVAS